MEWMRAMEVERAALMRLVALLHALAGLAELAAGRSPAVRGFVLWLLRRAEAVARDFVAVDPDPEAGQLAPGPAGNRPEDAMRLAASLRALAWQLEAQAALFVAACGGGRPGKPRPGSPVAAASMLAKILSALAPPAGHGFHKVGAPDTS